MTDFFFIAVLYTQKQVYYIWHQKNKTPAISGNPIKRYKMATVIRLARFGKRHNPIYRVVVIDNRKARDDSFIEQVGFFNPNLKQPEIRFEQEKVLKWLSVGAQPSDTVKSLLKKTGISDLFNELKANRSIEGKAPVAREIKSKKRKLSPKAQARLEAEKAAKEAAEAPAADAQA